MNLSPCDLSCSRQQRCRWVRTQCISPSPAPHPTHCELEVDAVGHVLDVDALVVRAVLEDELLEQEERLLVLDLLAHLDGRLPRVRRVAALARVALLVLEHELNAEDLLQLDAVKHLLLDRQLDAQATRVWLRPDEARVDELDTREARDLLEAHCEELARLELTRDPARAQVAAAAAALVEQD